MVTKCPLLYSKPPSSPLDTTAAARGICSKFWFRFSDFVNPLHLSCAFKSPSEVEVLRSSQSTPLRRCTSHVATPLHVARRTFTALVHLVHVLRGLFPPLDR